MTIKKVTDYMLFATGDACEFSMAGEPKYMLDNLTPSKHYIGYIKDVDTMRNEFTIVFTNDVGQPVSYRHLADPVRAPIGLPLYFHMTVLLDKETHSKRLYSRMKKQVSHALKQYEAAISGYQEKANSDLNSWSNLEDR